MTKPHHRLPSLYTTTTAILVVVVAGGFVLGSMVGLALAILMGIWLSYRVVRPVRQLTDVVRAYDQGQLSTAVPDTSIRELQHLSQSLQHMASAFQSRMTALASQHTQAAAILESMAEGVVAIDARARVVLINGAARRLFSVDDAAPSTGQNLFEVIRYPELHAVARHTLETRQPVMREGTLLHPYERHLRLRGVPCVSQEAAGASAVIVIQDITELSRYDRLRREFVANVSHELKSPVTSICSATETLLGGALEDAQHNRRFVALIDEDATRLTRLIDDLLALSRIESEAAPPKAAAVSVRPVVERVLASLESVIQQRRLTVQLDLPETLTVSVDPDRLRQVLFNLLENAAKYNRDGGTITISGRALESAVTLQIADTGMGIPPHDLPRIFERFYRVDKARSRDLGGTGLGLSIVKHIVEAYGGRVTVDSEPGRGSTFTVHVPR